MQLRSPWCWHLRTKTALLQPEYLLKPCVCLQLGLPQASLPSRPPHRPSPAHLWGRLKHWLKHCSPGMCLPSLPCSSSLPLLRSPLAFLSFQAPPTFQDQARILIFWRSLRLRSLRIWAPTALVNCLSFNLHSVCLHPPSIFFPTRFLVPKEGEPPLQLLLLIFHRYLAQLPPLRFWTLTKSSVNAFWGE